MEGSDEFLIDLSDIKTSGIEIVSIPTIEENIKVPDTSRIDTIIANFLTTKIGDNPFWKTNSTYAVDERINVFDMNDTYSEDIENENSAFFSNHWKEENLFITLKDHNQIIAFPLIKLCTIIEKRFARIVIEMILQLIDIHNMNQNPKVQTQELLLWNPDGDLFNSTLKNLMNRIIDATTNNTITRKEFEEAILGFTQDARYIREHTFTPLQYPDGFRNVLSFMFGYGYDINVELLHVKEKEARINALGKSLEKLRMDLIKNFQFPEIAKRITNQIEELESEQKFFYQSIQTTSMMTSILQANKSIYKPNILPTRLPIPTKSFSKMMAIEISNANFISPLYPMPYFYIVDIMRVPISRKYDDDSYHFARILRSNFHKDVFDVLGREITTYNQPVFKKNSNPIKLPGSLVTEEKWNTVWNHVFMACRDRSDSSSMEGQTTPPIAMLNYYDTITILMRIGVNPNICVHINNQYYSPMEILFTYFIVCNEVNNIGELKYPGELQYILDLVEQMLRAGYNLQLSPGTIIIGPTEQFRQSVLLERICSVSSIIDGNLEKLLLPCLYYGIPPLSVIYKCLIWCILNGKYYSAIQICKRLHMLDVGMNMYVGLNQVDGKVIREIKITPLLAAIYSNKPIMVDMVLSRGGNPNGLRTANGLERPLLAALKKDNGTMELLLTKLTSADYRFTHFFFNEPYENGTLGSRILQFGSVLDISLVLSYGLISPVDPIKISGQGSKYWFTFNNLMEYSQYLKNDAVNLLEPNRSKQLAISELLFVYFQSQSKYIQ